MHHNNGKKAVRYLSFLVTRCQKTITTTTTTPMKRREREGKKERRLYHYISENIVHLFTVCLYIEEKQRYSM
jgi:hypothetical protein